MQNCSVIIMAAGYSSRMGSLKFALALSDGTTFIENIVKQYTEFGCRQIIVVVNKEGKTYIDQHPAKVPMDITFVINQHPEYERYYSIKTGLLSVKKNHSVFIHNADNPFANYAVLAALYSNREEADLIKPVFNKKGGHPILISNKIVRDIILNENYNTNLNDFLKNYSSKEIETSDENILINVNTIDDYKKLLI